MLNFAISQYFYGAGRIIDNAGFIKDFRCNFSTGLERIQGSDIDRTVFNTERIMKTPFSGKSFNNRQLPAFKTSQNLEAGSGLLSLAAAAAVGAVTAAVPPSYAFYIIL